MFPFPVGLNRHGCARFDSTHSRVVDPWVRINHFTQAIFLIPLEQLEQFPNTNDHRAVVAGSNANESEYVM